MDTQTLTKRLQDLAIFEYEWSLLFFNSTKSRDGIELDFGKCEMCDVGSFIQIIQETLLVKTLADRPVIEYTPLLTNENIGVLSIDNELIQEPISDILLNAKNAYTEAPEHFGEGSYPTGYAFLGTKEDDRILIIRRSNPFIKAGKNRICTVISDKITANDKPILKFTPTVDLLVIDNNCYFITSNMNKDLGLESRHYAICAKRMALIAEKGLVNHYDQLEAAAMNSKNVRKFLDFDLEILEYIERLSVIDREEFLTTYGINLDNEGRIDTFDNEQCDLFIDLLCCRSCLDPLGRLAFANGISPRE